MSACTAIVKYDPRFNDSQLWLKAFQEIRDFIQSCSSQSPSFSYIWAPYVPLQTTPTFIIKSRAALLRVPGVLQPANGVYRLRLAGEQTAFDSQKKPGFIEIGATTENSLYATFDVQTGKTTTKKTTFKRHALYRFINHPGCFLLLEEDMYFKTKRKKRRKANPPQEELILRLKFENPTDKGPYHRDGTRYRLSWAEREQPNVFEVALLIAEEDLP